MIFDIFMSIVVVLFIRNGYLRLEQLLTFKYNIADDLIIMCRDHHGTLYIVMYDGIIRYLYLG